MSEKDMLNKKDLVSSSAGELKIEQSRKLWYQILQVTYTAQPDSSF